MILESFHKLWIYLNLLAIQMDSYRNFTQIDIPNEDRLEAGLHAAFKSVFPIVSYSGNAGA